MTTTEKVKHTGGPWRMGNHGQFGTFNPPQIFAESGEAVAQVYGIPLHTTLEEVNKERYAEGLANARLIAAAPEMAQLLLDVVHSPEQAWHSWLFKRDEILKKAGLLQ